MSWDMLSPIINGESCDNTSEIRLKKTRDGLETPSSAEVKTNRAPLRAGKDLTTECKR